jgi:hypothetical protein
MADQSKGVDYSVSYISLIETGQKAVPKGYVQRLTNWLQLSEDEAKRLCELADAETKTIEFRPADRERALLARDIALILNLLGTLQLAKFHKFLKEDLLR